MTFRSLPLSWVRAGLMAATLSLSVPAVQAAGPSDLSAVPVAVSVTAPSGFFAGSAMLVMVSAEARAEGPGSGSV